MKVAHTLKIDCFLTCSNQLFCLENVEKINAHLGVRVLLDHHV